MAAAASGRRHRDRRRRRDAGVPAAWTSAPPSRRPPSGPRCRHHCLDLVDPGRRVHRHRASARAYDEALADIDAAAHGRCSSPAPGCTSPPCIDRPRPARPVARRCAPSSTAEPGHVGAARPARRPRPGRRRHAWSRPTGGASCGRSRSRIGSGRPFSSFGPGLDAYPPTDVVADRPALAAPGARRRASSGGSTAMMRRRAARRGRPARAPSGLSRTAGQALGYKELLDHLDGACDARRRPSPRSSLRTRRFAVRQERWFRRDPRVRWIDIDARPARRAARRRDRCTVEVRTDDRITLTKHHGLGNDFLVVLRPAAPSDLPALAAAAVRPAHAASAPTGCSSASRDAGLRGPHGAVQRRRQPGRDERQRHPLLRPGAAPLAAATSAPQRIAHRRRRRAASSCAPTDDPRTIVAASTWARSPTSPSPPAGHAHRRRSAPPGRPPRRRQPAHRRRPSTTSPPSTSLALGAPVPARQPRDHRARPGADAITMRVHERGAGITEACGTGAVRRAPGPRAGGAWSTPARREIVVHMDGGDAKVRSHDREPGTSR